MTVRVLPAVFLACLVSTSACSSKGEHLGAPDAATEAGAHADAERDAAGHPPVDAAPEVSPASDAGAIDCSVVQCIYVRSGAGGSGTDWKNALGTLPSTLQRGATYFFASGQYTWGDLNTPDNGSVITLKGATQGNHGTSTGWQTSYSVDSSEGGAQAQLTRFSVDTNNWTIDGSVGHGASPDYGFGIHDNSNGGSVNFVNLAAGLTGVVFTHFEIDGVSCCSIDPNTLGTIGFYVLNGGPVGDVRFNRLYAHDLKGSAFLFGGTAVVEYSYFARMRYTESEHAELWSYRGGNGVVIRFNVVEDVAGTGEFVALYNTATNVEVYGNVFRATSACPAGSGCDGSEFPVNDNCVPGNPAYNGVIEGLKFYNNTIYSLHGNAGIGNCGESSGYDIRNNLWVDNAAGLSLGPTNTYDVIWNTYWFEMQTGPPSDTDWICGGNPSCVVNAPTANQGTAPTASETFVNAPGDLHLLASPIDGHALTGTPLPAPYDTDMDGKTRTRWNVGAYEFP